MEAARPGRTSTTLPVVLKACVSSGWVITLAPLCAVEIQLCIVNIPACSLMRAVDASDVDVLGPNVRTCFWARADNVSNERCKDSVCPAADVLEGDVCDVETCLRILVSHDLASREAMAGTHRMLETLILVVLAVALSDSDTVVDIVQPHAVIRHISDRARAATPLQVGRLLAKVIRPNFDASTLR